LGALRRVLPDTDVPPLKARREQCCSKLKSNLKHIHVHSFIPTGAPKPNAFWNVPVNNSGMQIGSYSIKDFTADLCDITDGAWAMHVRLCNRLTPMRQRKRLKQTNATRPNREEDVP
jgi:hypothetical protein